MCGKLDVEVEVLYGILAFKVINVLEHFLAFAMTFNVVVTHNMCVIQLDPRFKGLQCIVEYVGHDKVTTVVEKYD
jgi:hypothetical protein